jgi:hypothetical protein
MWRDGAPVMPVTTLLPLDGPYTGRIDPPFPGDLEPLRILN